MYNIDVHHVKGYKTMVDETTKRIDNLESKIEMLTNVVMCIKHAIDGQSEVRPSGDSGENETFNENPFDSFTGVEKEKINSVMEQFDFEKVQSVMEDLDWKWAGTKYGVPTVDEMKHEAKRLLVDAVEEKSTCATGGFRAVYESDGPNDPDPYIGLEFILEECEGFKEEDCTTTMYCGDQNTNEDDD